MNDLLPSANAVLSATPARWASLAQTIPGELLALPPAAGEWSVLECLQHLLDMEPIFQFRIKALLAGRDIPAYDPDSEGTKPEAGRTAAEMAADFARLRAASLAALALLTADDLGRRSVHQELGQVTLGELVHEWAAHDLNHTVQAERALMQPFIRGSGPWQKYFSDHLVGE